MNVKPEIRKPWERERVYTDLGNNQSVTDRSGGNDTDVNKIVARFSRTGHLPPSNREPQYCDVTSLQGDLTDKLEAGRKAAEELRELQAKAKKEARERIKADREELEKFRQAQKINQEEKPDE